MHLNDETAGGTIVAAVDLKFVENEPPGTLGGYASVVGVKDAHNDIVMPGAFAEAIADHNAGRRRPRMFYEHSLFRGGSNKAVGVWKSLEEDAKGLRVKGKLFALDTDDGKLLRDAIAEGDVSGLSIAYSVLPGGATFEGKGADRTRYLHKLKLHAIDLVSDPSNHLARIDGIKSILTGGDNGARGSLLAAMMERGELSFNELKSLLMQGDHESATVALESALRLHAESMSGGNSPNTEQRAAMWDHIATAYKAMNKGAMPAGMKSSPFEEATIREIELWLHLPRERGGKGHSIPEARELAARIEAKSSSPRDEVVEEKANADRKALEDIRSVLTGFSLTQS